VLTKRDEGQWVRVVAPTGSVSRQQQCCARDVRTCEPSRITGPAQEHERRTNTLGRFPFWLTRRQQKTRQAEARRPRRRTRWARLGQSSGRCWRTAGWMGWSVISTTAGLPPGTCRANGTKNGAGALRAGLDRLRNPERWRGS